MKSLHKERDSRLIITQVLNYGKWADVQWLLKTYPKAAIRTAILNPRRGSWLPDVLRFWTTVWKLKVPPTTYHRAIRRIEAF